MRHVLVTETIHHTILVFLSDPVARCLQVLVNLLYLRNNPEMQHGWDYAGT